MSLVSSLQRIFLIVFGIFSFSAVFANSEAEKEEREFEVGEMIMHHIKDAHEWHLWGGEHNGKSVFLPIILLDDGVKIFSSENFYHGEEKVGKVENSEETIHYVQGVGAAAGYILVHEKIFRLNSPEEEIAFDKEGHPHGLKKPLDFSITKNVLSLFFGAIILLIIMSSVARYYKKNGPAAPKGIAKFLEPLILMVRDGVAKANIGEHKYKKYVPYLLTIFFFVFFNNLLGLVPIIPGGANLTGNITVTFFLAVCTLLVTVFSGNRNYWGHIFATPGVPIPLLIIMIPIEVVGILTKPFALMVRLFANMTAGHIIVLALVSIIFINHNAWWGALSVPMALFISVLELLVAFLQAYLFVMLSALFIGAAVEEHHH